MPVEHATVPLAPNPESVSQKALRRHTPRTTDLTTPQPTTNSVRPSKFTITTLRLDAVTPADVVHVLADTTRITVLLPSAAGTAHAESTADSVSVDLPESYKPKPEPNAPQAAHAQLPVAAAESGAATPSPPVPSVTFQPGLSRKEVFPAGLHGVFYYWVPPPPIPALAGEVRFRITPQTDPLNVAAGKDFCLSVGIPWRIPLITFGEMYRLLRDMVVGEGLLDVDSETVEYAELVAGEYQLKRASSRIVHSFGQPFVLLLATTQYTFYFLHPDGLKRVFVTNLLRNDFLKRSVPRTYQPFTGQVLCCFERYVDPYFPAAPLVAIRVLKVLEPVSRRFGDHPTRKPYEPTLCSPDIPLPKEGQLLYCSGKSPAARRAQSHRLEDDEARRLRSSEPEVVGWGTWAASAELHIQGMRVLFGRAPDGPAECS